jgi:UDP-N-acetylglucosamine 2-epimerase
MKKIINKFKMILIAYGTRPEYIKIKPLLKEMSNSNIPFKVLFTGQHKDIAPKDGDFNFEMIDYGGNRLDSVLKNCLSLPEEYFSEITHVLVQGDTTTAMGLSIASMHRKIKVIHLEAGLRTFDNENPFPEENNRKIISTIASLHLCPTELNLKNLFNENVIGLKCVVGNTVLDNLVQYKEKCEYTNKVLITMHRRENHEKIGEWFNEISDIAAVHPHLEFIIPLHPNPNVQKHIDKLNSWVKIIEPLSHEELIELLIKTRLVITDSGGIQEECSFFNKKALVCRKITERPESVGITSFLVSEPEDLKKVFDEHINNYVVDSKCPYGDGYSSEKIINILKTYEKF